MAFHPERLTGARRRAYARSLNWTEPVAAVALPTTIRARLRCPATHVQAVVRVRARGGSLPDNSLHTVLVIRGKVVCLDHPDTRGEDALSFFGNLPAESAVCQCRLIAQLYSTLPIVNPYASDDARANWVTVRLRLKGAGLDEAVDAAKITRRVARLVQTRFNLPRAQLRDEVPAVLRAVRYEARLPAGDSCGPFELKGSRYTQRSVNVPPDDIRHLAPPAPVPPTRTEPANHYQHLKFDSRLGLRFVRLLTKSLAELSLTLTDDKAKPVRAGWSKTTDAVGFGTVKADPKTPIAFDLFSMPMCPYTWWVRLGRFQVGRCGNYLPFMAAYPKPMYPDEPPPVATFALALDLPALAAEVSRGSGTNIYRSSNVIKLVAVCGALTRDAVGGWQFIPALDRDGDRVVFEPPGSADVMP